MWEGEQGKMLSEHRMDKIGQIEMVCIDNLGDSCLYYHQQCF